ncbi:uncharacterized protein LOC5513485 [Nematostella vectensis]|uniref:uncharacterized protein LOC5513485 n=1 Tax=Nematostella vectensis TaxID=45351 RepID=UPI0020778573|nr:uncharacterized protein LOC5513485 [Nematostella vectensis]
MNFPQMRVILLSITLLSRTEHVICQNCPKGTCYAGTFSSKDQVTKGRYLLGASYRNLSSVSSPQACHSACVGDCRCRAFQMSGKRCELLDKDKDTVPISRFPSDESYEYYDLKQEIVKSSHMSFCSNGCCLGQRCLNGGTCVEHCEDPKKKFSCACTTSCSGRTCERCGTYRSCRDHHVTYRELGQEIADGVYQIQTEDGKSFPVFCAFEGDTAWVLLESFSLENKQTFMTLSFMEDNAFSEDTPNFLNYRLSRARMEFVRSKSTLFKATCAFDQKTQIPGWPRDQIIARLDGYDVVNQAATGSQKCVTFESIVIRNQSCSKCSIGLWHNVGKHHPHLDSTVDAFCSFNPFNSKNSEDNFGFYGVINTESTCCSSPDSTTQWWLGHEVDNV